MIEGIQTKQLHVIPDERGWIFEVLRSDDEIFDKFGQVYVTAVYPHVVKAWHYHKLQYDHFACVKGMIKVVAFDSREDSPTRGEVNEFFIGDQNPLLVKVPPFVYHGFKGIHSEISVVMNVPTLPYNRNEPDEYRLPADAKEIPYDWLLTPGMKHG